MTIVHESIRVNDEEALKLLVRESVREGIKAYHQELGLTPDHWAHLRREYERSKQNGNIVRRAVIGTALALALTFGYNAVTDHVAKVISNHIDQRREPRTNQIGTNADSGANIGSEEK